MSQGPEREELRAAFEAITRPPRPALAARIRNAVIGRATPAALPPPAGQPPAEPIPPVRPASAAPVAPAPQPRLRVPLAVVAALLVVATALGGVLAVPA